MRKPRLHATVGYVVALAAVTIGGCATTQPAGQQADDATITSLVKAKLSADPEVSPFDVDVDTYDGVVTLRGRVEDAEAKDEAGRLAGNTAGVRAVHNLIEVGELSGTDAALVAAVTARLAADSDASAVNIDVDAQDGVVTLTGTVKSEQARQKAERVALSVDGVRAVNLAGLAVEGGTGGGCRPCYPPKCKCDDCSCKESCCKTLEQFFPGW